MATYPLPRLAQCCIERAPPWTNRLSSEKSPAWTFSFPSIVGCFPGGPLESDLTGITVGNPQGWTTQDQIETEKGISVYSNQSWDLGRQCSCWSGTQTEMAASGSAHLQSLAGGPIRPESLNGNSI